MQDGRLGIVNLTTSIKERCFRGFSVFVVRRKKTWCYGVLCTDVAKRKPMCFWMVKKFRMDNMIVSLRLLIQFLRCIRIVVCRKISPVFSPFFTTAKKHVIVLKKLRCLIFCLGRDTAGEVFSGLSVLVWAGITIESHHRRPI